MVDRLSDGVMRKRSAAHAGSRRVRAQEVVRVVTELAREPGVELEVTGADSRCPRCTGDL